MAVRFAIFDTPSGHTSWEAMKPPLGGTFREEGTSFATRHLFF
jgi:hypothetical protein